MKFNCNKTEKCSCCSMCCHFREHDVVDDTDDDNIKRSLFVKTGVIYLYNLNKYTINLTPKEKEELLIEAKNRNIEIKILPKKIFLGEDYIYVYDYFIDAEICPFLVDKRCSIYEKRPKICREFPKIIYDSKEFHDFQDTHKIIKKEYDNVFSIIESHFLKDCDSKKTESVS